jgi:hypothetical protein
MPVKPVVTGYGKTRHDRHTAERGRCSRRIG